ncbi:MAG: hypothetical protein L6Q38_03350 [Nitrospira sp.]|nr:hypothetical protein [Nitrospira sp.]
MAKKLALSDQIRRAVDASGRSRYSICKEAGIDQAAMSRFMAGDAGLLLEALDRLGQVLDLQVKARKAKRRG